MSNAWPLLFIVGVVVAVCYERPKPALACWVCFWLGVFSVSNGEAAHQSFCYHFCGGLFSYGEPQQPVEIPGDPPDYVKQVKSQIASGQGLASFANTVVFVVSLVVTVVLVCFSVDPSLRR